MTHRRLPQRPSEPGGYGWVKEAFHQLRAVSSLDLRIGTHVDVDRATILTRAIKDAYRNIEKMPVRYITYPSSADGQLFESAYMLVPATAKPLCFRIRN